MSRDQRPDPELPPGPGRDLVDLFRQLRRRTPMSGGQLALRTGLSASHISDVLRGRKAPGADTARRIVTALGASQADTMRAMRLAEDLTELNRYRRKAERADQQTGRRQPPERETADEPGQWWHRPWRAAEPGPRLISWPHRVGVVPLPAQCLQDRPERAVLLDGLTRAGAGDLASGSTHVLHGLGGVGKTQLAAQCAERLFTEGELDLLVWITGGRGEIEASLAQAGVEVTGIADGADERGARRFLAWLATTRRRWLVVIDDLAAPADLSDLWPPAGGRTMVTTRRRDASLAGPGRKIIEIGLFGPEQATGYLRSRLADQPHLLSGAELLAEDLGYLPLALSQAAAYLLDRDLSCADYRSRFAGRRARLASLLPEPDALPDAHRETVAATWSLSVELANRLAPAGLARPLLELVAVLDPGGIPAEVFGTRSAREYLEAVLSGSGNAVPSLDQQMTRDGLRCLARLSLLTLDHDAHAEVVRAHALVQRAIADSIAADQLGRAVRAAAGALAEAWVAAERDHRLAAALRANVDALTSGYEELLWSPGPHPVLVHYGRSLGAFGAAAKAAAYFEQLRATAERALGADHADTLVARHELLHWRGEAGAPGEARSGFEVLTADLARVLGPEHELTFAARHELAVWLGQGGDAAAAAAVSGQLLADRLRVLGPDHQDTLTSRGNYAWWQGKAGDVAGASAQFAVLLAELTRTLGPRHAHTLAARHNLAYWRGRSGDPAGAAAGFDELLADLAGILGPDHPDTMNARNSLAWWRGAAGDPASAAAQYADLLADRLRVLGADHRLVIVTRHNLAHWRGEAGDFAGAAAAYAELLADRIRTVGADHPHTLAARSELARWRGAAGDPAGAVLALEELLADRLRILGPDDPGARTTRDNLARWRREAGEI